MPGWAAQSFRIAWFGSGLENVGADQVFLKAFGLEAENIHRNRVPSQANPFWSKASGSIVEGRQAADVQIQPGRLDIVLMPISEDVAPTLPLDALDKYLGGMSASLGDLGPAVRLAIICEVVALVESATEASVIAQKLARITEPLDSITDFSYQLNSRRPFKVSEDQTMNRLVRWATSSFQFVRVSMGPDATMAPITELSHAAAVFMDLNNVPSSRPLEAAEQVAMYEELAGEFARLAKDPTLDRLLVNDA